jgi:hypothetical protein
MQTNEVANRSLSVGSAPSAVLDVLGDPHALPRCEVSVLEQELQAVRTLCEA